MAKWVYTFGGGTAEGAAEMRDLLGGKGANLAEMCALGLPVPPGFTITTDACNAYYDNDETYPDGLEAEVTRAVTSIEAIVGKRFGDATDPLLVSVRSGARASMPGMMDTVLNLGLNDETVAGLASKAGDMRFALDSYRRFIQMYSDVVLDVGHHNFEDILEYYKDERGLRLDTELEADDWAKIIEKYKACVKDALGKPFPQDVSEQLWGGIGAVFRSWMNPRATKYREIHDIPARWGTAVNIQAMVFGNMGDDSATGVAFTRNPSTGENALYGEYLINAQGEDVVAGIRTPQELTEAARAEAGSDHASMETALPDTFKQFAEICQKLENHYRDMQDIEFTVERGTLYMLQTRSGKRTTKAALKIAVDMVDEGLISESEAVMRIDASALDQLLHPTIDPDAETVTIAAGLPASPGAATGEIVLSSEDAERLAQEGRKCILVRVETSPEDIHGMHAAQGILTTRGGMTSHAAVVARGMGTPCVSGAGSIRIDYTAGTVRVGPKTLKTGDVITVDGSTGKVLDGEVPMLLPELSGDFQKVMGWADEGRRMQVRTNADTPADVQVARDFGAEGIGLCRTEHMFFDDDRIMSMRQMIVAEDEAGRRKALDKILPMQRQDFEEIFVIMHGLPVTIRLLDPPLHEFLPHDEAQMVEVAAAIGTEPDKLKRRVQTLTESNPMLGHRGCRLGITYPEIYEMQVRAIFEASIAAAAKTDDAVTPEIMIPLVVGRAELDYLKTRIERVAKAVEAESGKTLCYQIGTMIELPRAALRAAEIAQSAEFFSFGTNDLTQTTFGISRDDAGAFLTEYTQKGLMEIDPFISLDADGVGELVRIGVERGQKTRPDIKLGICGEHGGDPASIRFCESVGLNYVSCSPYRVPIARLAAAQSAIAAKGD
jgi:pyruvate,orthophosphate dikinase